jgi:hypothetical protein
MQTLAFHLFAAQFFSRPFMREDVVKPHTQLKTDNSITLDGHLTIRFGNPLLEGPGDTRIRANYTQPWELEKSESASTDRLVDPFAEIRWPAYALATFHLVNPEAPMPTLDVAVQCDLLQALRNRIDAELGEIPEIKAMADQFLGYDANRFSYWTPLLDSVGNPIPVSSGDYIGASRAEPVGPGFAALRGTGVTRNGAEYCSLALVWSQAFSAPAETGNPEPTQLQKRLKELKTHFEAKEDIKRADECLQKSDLRGCISFAQIAVESAIRFYCNQWGARFPSLPGIDFHQRIERVLKRAGRPSYQAIDPAGLTDLLHLYRASLKAHDANCYFHDDQLHRDVSCEVAHVEAFLDAAIRFTFWIDSLA